jgi:hypothetical protein
LRTSILFQERLPVHFYGAKLLLVCIAPCDMVLIKILKFTIVLRIRDTSFFCQYLYSYYKPFIHTKLFDSQKSVIKTKTEYVTMHFIFHIFKFLYSTVKKLKKKHNLQIIRNFKIKSIKKVHCWSTKLLKLIVTKQLYFLIL